MTTEERLSRDQIELRIMRSAVEKCGAANYIWPEIVTELIARGWLERRSELTVSATSAGRVAFSGAPAPKAKRSRCPNPRDCGDPTCDGECGY